MSEAKAPELPEIWGEKYHEGLRRYGDNGTNCVVCAKHTGRHPQHVQVDTAGRVLPALPDLGLTEEAMGYFPIGSECAKTLPKEYLADWG